MKVGAHRASLRLTFVAIVAFAAAPAHAQSDGADATAPETPAPRVAAEARPSETPGMVDALGGFVLYNPAVQLHPTDHAAAAWGALRDHNDSLSQSGAST